MDLGCVGPTVSPAWRFGKRGSSRTAGTDQRMESRRFNDSDHLTRPRRYAIIGLRCLLNTRLSGEQTLQQGIDFRSMTADKREGD